MGISTIQSYQGSQIFEAIGISQEVIDAYFTGTVSRIGGITLKDIAAQTDAQHSKAFDPLGLATDLTLSSMGRHKMRSQGEEHRYNPQTIHMLQQATRDGSYEKFCEYTKMVDKEETGYLRSLMDFNFPETGVPIEEVESVESIVKRFKTGAEKLDLAAKAAEDAKRELAKARYELEVAQGQQRAAEDAVLKLQGDKNHYDLLLSSLRERLESLDTERETIARRRGEVKRVAEEKEALVLSQEKEAGELRAQAEKSLSGQSELLRSTSRLGDEIAEKKSVLAGYAAERETTEKSLASLEGLRAQMQGDEQSRRALIEQYRAASEQSQREIGTHETEIAALSGKMTEKRAELEALSKAKLALEAERSQSDRRGRELNENVLNVERSVSKLEQKRATSAMEEQQILDKLWENYELSHSAAQEQRIELESVAKASRRIGELKRAISGLGAVNVGAIEEFERVNTRYTYLTTQRDDVEKAKGELVGVIDSITSEMTVIFKEQFALIRESFQETFLELFGGGKATLELEDENDVLSCGIEIKVQPPGKALKTITLLSGGEKAFVAIALYFAILKVHPTPFCVMDEIEAALDEPNVVRVANYMRRITSKTQFIVITHRRGTMEAADVLYGVTMQERGVSKVLTINMNDMAKELNIKE